MSKSDVRTTALRRKSDNVSGGVWEPTVDTDAIARRAYERFEQRGREHGRDVEDWLDAERELGAGRPDSQAKSAEPAALANDPRQPVGVE